MSHCQNCPKFLHKCQAECCSCAPMDASLFRKHLPRVVRQVVDQAYMTPDVVVPITVDGRCAFLNQNLSCNIYEDRPFVCQKYGDESHINMTCGFQTKEGNARSDKDRKRIEEKQRWMQEKFFNRQKTI